MNTEWRHTPLDEHYTKNDIKEEGKKGQQPEDSFYHLPSPDHDAGSDAVHTWTMFSLETYPALYLAYLTAPPATTPTPPSTSCPASSSSSCRRSRSPHSGAYPSLGNARRATSAPPGECRSCGVPLRVFRKCCAIRLPENMTAHLCITTYRSPDNSVLKLEVGVRVGWEEGEGERRAAREE